MFCLGTIKEVIIPILTLIVLGLYTYFTGCIVKASREANEERKELFDIETAPYVVGFIKISAYVEFIIKNMGKSTAINIKVEFPDFLDLVKNEDKNQYEKLFTNELPSLVPGEEYKIFLGHTMNYCQYMKGKNKSYNFQISYMGGVLNTQRKYKRKVDIDLLFFDRKFIIDQDYPREIVEKLGKITDAILKIE